MVITNVDTITRITTGHKWTRHIVDETDSRRINNPFGKTYKVVYPFINQEKPHKIIWDKYQASRGHDKTWFDPSIHQIST